MYTFTELQIPGYQGRPVPNSFVRQEQETRHLAFVFPGVGYNGSMPLLYYPARMLTGQGADVLRVDYDYRRMDPGVREGAFAADVTAAWQAGLAERPYERVTLIGKSLGTLALGHLLATVPDPPPLRSIWLTPLFGDERLRRQALQVRHPAFFAAGTADAHHDAQALAAVQEATGGEALVIEGANHSLELEGDAIGSIHILERVMRAIQAFLG